MGLHAEFRSIWKQILNTTPIPPMATVYAMIKEAENRHDIVLISVEMSLGAEQMIFLATNAYRYTPIFCGHYG